VAQITRAGPVITGRLLWVRTVKLPSLNPEMFNGDVMFGYRNAQKEAVDFAPPPVSSWKLDNLIGYKRSNFHKVWGG
jgi:hypothetical protein